MTKKTDAAHLLALSSREEFIGQGLHARCDQIERKDSSKTRVLKPPLGVSFAQSSINLHEKTTANKAQLFIQR
jgi:hypothetical protein